MSPDDFKAWRKAMGFTQTEAGKALGISLATVGNYETGKRREDSRAVTIPLSIGLACAALFHRLGPWKRG